MQLSVKATNNNMMIKKRNCREGKKLLLMASPYIKECIYVETDKWQLV